MSTEHPNDQSQYVNNSEMIDHHSFANPQEARTKHLDLDLTVDFNQKLLRGKAQWTLENNKANQIIFDTRDLIIEKVTTGTGAEEKEAEYTLSEPIRFMGQALNIKIQPSTEVVTIYYQTQPGSAALDWLSPEQTGSKKHPFLYTQGQAILTRTWIPSQDSPGIRITYNARIKVPEALMAVMSASNPQQKNEEGIYTFTMEQPIPPYLLALAVGDLRFEPIGEHTGVYAEPYIIEEAVYEFGEMEQMLQEAEQLYGAYLWDRYDVIVLPPSFPFGGMENPRLTFATPTIIAGDRSLVALIAHELAHSWSGNLVTNATWNDFWLNEGFTVYFERRIMEALKGKEYVEMLAELGYQDLVGTIDQLEEEGQREDTRLQLNLKDRDPDDGMTDIAYEKGALFLKTLEEAAGRDTFDAFLKQYFETHKFQTISTPAFIHYLNEHLIEPNGLDISPKVWIYEPGLPEGVPIVSSTRFRAVEAQLEAFLEEGSAAKVQPETWTTHEWLHFIRKLPEELAVERMQKLDEAFQLSKSGNSEILNAWFELAIYTGYAQQIQPQIEAFLIKVGRRKFLTPLYRAYKKTGQLELAQSIFEKARPNYHSVSRNSIDELLNG